MTKPLDPSEDARAALLSRCGLARAEARVLAALARGPMLAQDLADAAGLSRQQAADAANALELRKIVRVERIPSGGRPSNRYHIGDLGDLVKARREEIAAELAALDDLERSL